MDQKQIKLVINKGKRTVNSKRNNQLVCTMELMQDVTVIFYNKSDSRDMDDTVKAAGSQWLSDVGGKLFTEGIKRTRTIPLETFT